MKDIVERLQHALRATEFWGNSSTCRDELRKAIADLKKLEVLAELDLDACWHYDAYQEPIYEGGAIVLYVRGETAYLDAGSIRIRGEHLKEGELLRVLVYRIVAADERREEP